MAQVSIIEIDLGLNITDLINEDVVGLVGEAQQELETAIAVAKQTAELKEKKAKEAQESADKITVTMTQAYDILKEAGEQGVSVDKINDIINNIIPSLSAFTLRMKKILRDEGNEYAIVKKKIDGKPHYIFMPFNKTPDDE
jgi:hypothetical protein